MRKLVVLVALGVASALLLGGDAADAFQRYVAPQYHPMPVPQYRPAPQYRANPGVQPRYYNHVGPGTGPHLGNLGPHGHPMIQGVHGWHEAHNRSFLRGSLPAALFGLSGDQYIDVESYIDGIDVSSAIEPVSSCYETQCLWGGISAATDGAWAGAVDAPTEIQARSNAHERCLQYSHGVPCESRAEAVGNEWVVAVLCQNDNSSNTIVYNGNDFGAALRNAYRFAAEHGFAVDDCGFIGAIAADNSQGQYAQAE